MASFDVNWHKGPTMNISGSFSCSVSGMTINVSGNASNSFVYSGSSYGYNVTGYVAIDGNNSGSFQVTSRSGSGSTNFSGSRTVNAGNHTVTIHICCGQTGGCSNGYDDVTVASETVYVADPERAATNVTGGVVHTTNGDNAMVSAYNGNQVWFDYWGYANGYPTKNEIDHFNIDCSKTNDVNAASSVAETQSYSKNAKINASTLKSRYSMNDGDTLYCWVNTCLKSGSWLGRVYLGKFTLQNPVNVALNSCTSMVKLGSNISIGYVLSDCNTSIAWTKARIYDSAGTTLLKTIDLSKTALGTYTSNVSTSGLAEGTTYQIAVRVSDNWQEVESGKKSFTIQDPVNVAIDSCTQIVKMGNNLSLKYTLSDCNTTITSTKAKIYNSAGTTLLKTIDLGKTALGTYTSNVTTSGLANGTQYKISVICNDSWQDVESSKSTFYTYREPIMNNSLSIQTNPQNAVTANKFTISGTNNRAWSSLENEFQTRYRLKVGTGNYGSWTNLGNITEWSRTAAEMRTLVPKTNDGTDITIQMERYSPSASWESTNKPAVTFKVYYRPRNGISDASYKFTNSSGSAISKNQRIQKDKDVYASWTYDTTVANAGYLQGYRIRLYNSAGTVTKTYYTSNKYYTIPISDIVQGQNTKIDITPYYQNDSTTASDYWYYNGTISKVDFVFVRRGYLYYKDNSGNWHSCDYLYKDRTTKCPTLEAKDKNGTYHEIDLLN